MDTSERQTASIEELYLIHDGNLDVQHLRDVVRGRKLIAVEWGLRDTVPAQSRVLLFLGDEQVRDLISLAVERQWEVGLLAHKGAASAIRTWGVNGGIEQLTRHYLQIEAIDADVFTCNDQVVLSSVVVGEVLALKPYDAADPPSRSGMFLDALKHMILPAFALGIAFSPAIMRVLRSSLLDVYHEDYIHQARLRGVSESRVLIRHGLKNAILPTLSLMGVQFGILFGGTLLVEVIYSYPGLGNLMVDAVRNADLPIIQAVGLTYCIVVLIINMCHGLRGSHYCIMNIFRIYLF